MNRQLKAHRSKIAMVSFVLFLLVWSCRTAFACELTVTGSTAPETIFKNSVGWTGGDGVFSTLLPSGRVLWFFGDTFDGVISGGKRIDSVMVHNTMAVCKNASIGDIRFVTARRDDKAVDLFAPENGRGWYWPGAAVTHNGRLYLFLKRVVSSIHAKPPFNFSWVEDVLLLVSNPEDDPLKWHCHEIALLQTDETHHLGTAVLDSEEFLYVYGQSQQKAVVARAEWKELESGKPVWTYLSPSGEWQGKIENAAPLFAHAAAEMSVSKFNDGYVCVYSRDGLGPEIVGRCASTPYGPFSEEELLYKVSGSSKLLTYAAKAHAELSRNAQELCITYCLNCGDLAEHVAHPDIYFPRMVRITLGGGSRREETHSR